MLKIAEWGGAAFGIVGSTMLAMNSVLYSGYGFLVFLLSNLCWLFFGLKSKTWGMVAMQVGFTLTNLVGVYNWLLAGKI